MDNRLFNFMQTTIVPTDDALDAQYLQCTALGIFLSFFLILCYAQLPGPMLWGGEDNSHLVAKLRTYGYLYMHMPLCVVVTIVSTQLGHCGCMEAAAPGRLQKRALRIIGVGCGIILVFLAVLHVLAEDRNWRRSSLRAGSGLLLAVVQPTLEMGCRPLLLVISMTMAAHVVLDHATYFREGSRQK